MGLIGVLVFYIIVFVLAGCVNIAKRTRSYEGDRPRKLVGGLEPKTKSIFPQVGSGLPQKGFEQGTDLAPTVASESESIDQSDFAPPGCRRINAKQS